MIDLLNQTIEVLNEVSLTQFESEFINLSLELWRKPLFLMNRSLSDPNPLHYSLRGNLELKEKVDSAKQESASMTWEYKELLEYVFAKTIKTEKYHEMIQDSPHCSDQKHFILTPHHLTCLMHPDSRSFKLLSLMPWKRHLALDSNYYYYVSSSSWTSITVGYSANVTIPITMEAPDPDCVSPVFKDMEARIYATNSISSRAEIWI